MNCPPCNGNCRQGRDCPAGDETTLETFDKVWLCVGAVILVPSAIAMVVGIVCGLWDLGAWALGVLS